MNYEILNYLGLNTNQLEDVASVIKSCVNAYGIDENKVYKNACSSLEDLMVDTDSLGGQITECFFDSLSAELALKGVKTRYYINGLLDTAFYIIDGDKEVDVLTDECPILWCSSYEQFYELIKKNIKDYLPDNYRDATIIVENIHKSNYTFDGLVVRTPDQKVAPIVNLNSLLDFAYDHNWDKEAALKEAARIITSDVPEELNLMDWIMDYSKAKSRLFIRVCSYEKNKDNIRELPHIRICDMAITAHILVSVDSRSGSVTVSNEIARQWGVTGETVIADAVANAEIVLPAKINKMQEALAELGVLHALPESGPEVYVVTNDRNMFGASALFYKGILDKIGELIGGDFYVLPSSIHEVICVRADSENVDVLRDMVRGVNSTVVDEAEQLSDSVYCYSVAEKRFSVLG